MNQIAHVIFDVDGVLVDSVNANHITLLSTMAHFGFAADESEFIESPVPTTAKLAYLEQTQGITLTEKERVEFARMKYEALTNNFDLIDINPTAAQCIGDIIAAGVSVSYVSNARVSYVNAMLAKLGLSNTGKFVLGNDSNFRHKPHPDMFEHIAQQININAANVLVVDDTDVNLASATASGFATFKVSKFSDLTNLKV